FWTSILRSGKHGPISVWAGDQTIEIATVPALIQQSYGIADDQKELMRFLDEEAPLIAAKEDVLADIALGSGLDEGEEFEDEEDSDINEGEEFKDEEDPDLENFEGYEEDEDETRKKAPIPAEASTGSQF